MSKPKIFLVPEFERGGDIHGYALAEDGEVVGNHISSSVDFLHHDLGLGGKRRHHLDDYDKKYPDGYELVPILPHETTPELEAASQLAVRRGFLVDEKAGEARP